MLLQFRLQHVFNLPDAQINNIEVAAIGAVAAAAAAAACGDGAMCFFRPFIAFTEPFI